MVAERSRTSTALSPHMVTCLTVITFQRPIPIINN